MQQDKITDLPELATAAADDVLEITDVSASASNKVQVRNLALAVLDGVPNGSITNDMVGFTAGADASSSLELGTNVTATDMYLTKVNNLVILTGFFNKSGNFSTGDTVLTLPEGYRPVAGVVRTIAHGGSVDKLGRIEATTFGSVVIRNVSSSTPSAIFTLIFPVA